MKTLRSRKKHPSFALYAAVIFIVFTIVLTALFALASRKNEVPNDTETDTENAAQTDNNKDDITTEVNRAAETDPPETESETTEPVTESPETEAPKVQTIPLGIYKKDGKKCRLITEYKSEWPKDDGDSLWKLDTWTYKDRKNLICDVAYFAVFTSSTPEIKFTKWDETWLPFWESAGLDDSYKIGFQLTAHKFDGTSVSATVLSPDDTFALEEYFELYLYDCVYHAHDSWYSHITEKTNYDDTKNVMIKITLRDGCYELENITLTAFVYDSKSMTDEFDGNGCYIGANKALCIIGRE